MVVFILGCARTPVLIPMLLAAALLGEHASFWNCVGVVCAFSAVQGALRGFLGEG
jgi:hypothetical protein